MNPRTYDDYLALFEAAATDDEAAEEVLRLIMDDDAMAAGAPFRRALATQWGKRFNLPRQ